MRSDRISRDRLKRADNHWAEIWSGKVTYRIVGTDRGTEG
jgi:hypothetical protein